jgi:hypothetical protein
MSWWGWVMLNGEWYRTDLIGSGQIVHIIASPMHSTVTECGALAIAGYDEKSKTEYWQYMAPGTWTSLTFDEEYVVGGS